MANEYDPTSAILSGNTYDINAVISALKDDLPVITARDHDGADKTIASTTFSTINTVTITAALDEWLLIIGQVSFSSGTDGDQAKFQLTVDGTQFDPSSTARCNGASTGGETNHMTLVLAREISDGGSAGTYDIDLDWARNSGADTVYLTHATLDVFQFKKQ